MIPKIIQDNITEIEVRYFNFENEDKLGIVICNKNVSDDLTHIFNEIFELKFPIERISPISVFDNDDEKSVRGNNTSCFNFRYVIGSNKLSDHSTGNAIDINPMQNPWVHPSAHKIDGRKYEPNQKGTITKDIVDIFSKYGWNWGGNWRNPDYQHFFKADNQLKQKLIDNPELFNFENFLTFIKNK